MNRSPSASSTASPTRPAPSALPEGSVFAGRYRVVRTIAAGGMGTVYEVVHTETERRRALKVMHPHLFQSDEMRERFQREARIAGQVESEYIVDVSDAGVDEATRTPFIVMELLQGEDLGQRLKRLGRLPPAEVLTLLQQVGLALDRTHARSIVHRDLKPDNVFLTVREDGSPRVKILDFGVAKLVAEGATSAGATRSLGTPLYMSPEQFRLGSKLVAAADIYALGMMAYTLLVGQPYWATEAKAAGDVIAFAMTVVLGPQESAVRRAAQSGVTLPPAFDAWFARVAAPSPDDRYKAASEAVRALAAALAPAAARPAVAPAPASPVAAAAPEGPRRAATVPMPPSMAALTPAAPAPISRGTAVLSSMPLQGPVSSAPGRPAPAASSGAAPPASVRPSHVPSSPVSFHSLPAHEPGPPSTAGIPSARGGSPPSPSAPLSQPLPGGPAAAPAPQPPRASGILEQASSSMGAAVAPIPPERSRAPLVLVLSVIGLVLAAVTSWFLLGRSGDPGAAASSAPKPSPAPSPKPPASPPKKSPATPLLGRD